VSASHQVVDIPLATATVTQHDLHGAAAAVAQANTETYPDAHWPVQIREALQGLIHAANTARAEGLPAIPDQVAAPPPSTEPASSPRCVTRSSDSRGCRPSPSRHKPSPGTVLAVPQVRVAARWICCSRAASIER
jgi:hypothetical protein